MTKTRVFVSSTSDLKHIRNNIHAFLNDARHEAVLYEKGDVLYHNSITLQSNCLEEVKSCNILIGIIGNRFGTESESDSEISVSMSEIRTAQENNKQVYLFVENETWHENSVYEQNRDNDTINYKADVKIHRFISEMKQKKQNNVLHPFSSVNEIIDFLRAQFSGLMLRGLRSNTNDGLGSETSVPPISVEKIKEEVLPTVKYQDRKYGFNFHYPQDWKVISFPLAHICVVGPPDNEFSPNVSIQLLPPANNKIFQITMLAFKQQLEIQYRNVKIKDFGITKIGDKDCLRCHFQATVGEAWHLEILHLVFLHKDKTFIVRAEDKQTNFEKNINTFKGILGSIQFGKRKGKTEKDKLRKAVEKSSEIKEKFHYHKKYYRSDYYYEFTLIKLNNQYFLSDQGKTYEMLDKIFELKEPDVIKNLDAIAKECEIVVTEDERLVIPLDFWNDSPNDEQKQLLEEAKCKMFTCVAFMDTMRIFYV